MLILTSRLAEAPEIGASDQVKSSRSTIQENKKFIIGSCFWDHSLHSRYTGLRLHQVQALAVCWQLDMLHCNEVLDGQPKYSCEMVYCNTLAHYAVKSIYSLYVHHEYIPAAILQTHGPSRLWFGQEWGVERREFRHRVMHLWVRFVWYFCILHKHVCLAWDIPTVIQGR